MQETLRQILVVGGMLALLFGSCLERETFVDTGVAEVRNLLQDHAFEARLTAFGGVPAFGVVQIDGNLADLHIEAEVDGLPPGTYTLWLLDRGTCARPVGVLSEEPPRRLYDPEGTLLAPTWTVLDDPSDEGVGALFSGRGHLVDEGDPRHVEPDLYALVGSRVVIDRVDPRRRDARGTVILCGTIHASRHRPAADRRASRVHERTR